jgi:hypothetical protein
MNIRIGLLASLIAVGCATPESIEPIEPIQVETVMKGSDVPVPGRLRDGRATWSDVARWTESLRGGREELIATDLNGDGQADLMAELAYARGATGNRFYFLFIESGRGYRYVGRGTNLARVFRFASGRSYVLMYSKGGGAHYGLALHETSNHAMRKIGRDLRLVAHESEPETPDARLWDRLWKGEWSEADLLAVFGKSM